MSNKENDNPLSFTSNSSQVEASQEHPKLIGRKKKKRSQSTDKQEIEERRQSALAQMKYMLSLCDKYAEVYRKALSGTKKQSGPTLDDIENVKTEIKKNSKPNKGYDITSYLQYFNGKLHPYQVEGVTWLYMLYANGTNGILADEMGLGKTIQIIALICILLKQNVAGPYLIVAPLSTIPNWESEFKKFAPEVPIVVVSGNRESRQQNMPRIFRRYTIGTLRTYPVVIASYQIPLFEFHELDQLKWTYIIVDEGQVIKNPNSQLCKVLKALRSESRLILTGTPLQNNMMELWSLLNFLLPTFFSNMEVFTQLFLMEDLQNEDTLIQQEQCNNIVTKIHKVLAPFMLRRLKKDVLFDMVPKKEVIVYCPLSDLQIELYNYVIDKNIAALRGTKKKVDIYEPKTKRKCTEKQANYRIPDEDELDIETPDLNLKNSQTDAKQFTSVLKRLTMQNTMMMFRKIVSHPYLVHFPLDPNSEVKQLLINEDLVTSSGKLKVLDSLLPALIKRGHKILLFSQLCMGLDLIEEYVILRNINYRRLDGSQTIELRAVNIKQFNEDPKVSLFLLSTRSGSLGLNLTAADTVIFFDKDWNPQVDIQAQDRCHRIGQTKPIMIYTLIAKNTIDERVLEASKMKRMLERVVISEGKFKTITPDDKIKTKDFLLELKRTLQSTNDEDSYNFSNELKLNELLDRSDLYKVMEGMASNEASCDIPEKE